MYEKKIDKNTLPLVTVGIVNCNRLFYLRSCLESFLECTSDYPNKEIIIVDNASVEEGTEEYLKEKEQQGVKVFRQLKRDPNNEFARGLNLIHKESQGNYVIMLQGDMQFVLRGGWLERYVNFYQNYEEVIGCIGFDAQRTITNQSHTYSERIGVMEDGTCSPGLSGFGFVADGHRPPAGGAADSMYSKKVLDMIAPWSEDNTNHEIAGDSETKMLQNISSITKAHQFKWMTFLPVYPPSVMIYTDKRGTNARVRNNKRYGDYWMPKKGCEYYEIKDFEIEMSNHRFKSSTPIGIEKIANPVGWEAPIDESGNWKKNPIRVEEALPSDYVVLYDEEKELQHSAEDIPFINEIPDYLNEWLDS